MYKLKIITNLTIYLYNNHKWIGERERITVEIDQLRLGPIVEDDGCQRLIQLMGNDELRILEDGVFIIGAGLYDYGPECTPHLSVWAYLMCILLCVCVGVSVGCSYYILDCGPMSLIGWNNCTKYIMRYALTNIHQGYLGDLIRSVAAIRIEKYPISLLYGFAFVWFDYNFDLISAYVQLAYIGQFIITTKRREEKKNKVILDI